MKQENFNTWISSSLFSFETKFELTGCGWDPSVCLLLVTDELPSEDEALANFYPSGLLLCDIESNTLAGSSWLLDPT